MTHSVEDISHSVVSTHDIGILHRPGWSSSYQGVSWDKSRGKWMAYIKIHGQAKNLGRFTSELEAAQVAREARLKLMPFTVEPAL